MADAASAIALWQRVHTSLGALQQFAKLVSVVSAAWPTLKKFTSRDQRKKLKVKKLREDLLIISKELREVHFVIGEKNLLPTGDFFAQELMAVLAKVETACAAEPKLYELEVAMDKAVFVQARARDKLVALLACQPRLTASAPPIEELCDLSGLTEKSCIVAQALQTAGHGVFYDRTDSLMSDGYDTAAESESEWPMDPHADSDEDYVSCDEDEFWKAARCHFIAKPGISAAGSSNVLGVPLGRSCSMEQLDSALLELGEEPTWRKVQDGHWQHASIPYSAVLDKKSSGDLCINGPGTGKLVHDLRTTIDRLTASSSMVSHRQSFATQPVVMFDKKGRIVKYADDETLFFDFNGIFDDSDDDL